MRKVILILLGVVVFASVSFAGNYRENVQEIDALIASCEEVSIGEMFSVDAFGASAMNANATSLSSVNPWAAWAICWVVGGFGIHRHYMGTSDYMWAIYTFTCGGIFGIVTFVDWVALLIGAIKDDIGRYTNNDSFFMWAN